MRYLIYAIIGISTLEQIPLTVLNIKYKHINRPKTGPATSTDPNNVILLYCMQLVLNIKKKEMLRFDRHNVFDGDDSFQNQSSGAISFTQNSNRAKLVFR